MGGARRIVCKVIDADDWRSWRSLRRAALAEAPDAFSSTLLDWSGGGDTEERWRGRLDAIVHNVLAELEGRPVGMVSAQTPFEGTVHLISMWVAPEARGIGVGDLLVAHVIEWARQSGAERVALDVRAANRHAIALYRRHGFADAGPSSEEGDPHPERRMVAVLEERVP